MNAATFPTQRVIEITGKRPPEEGDPLVYHTYTADELRQLVECGAANPEETQNDSGTIAEFLELATKHPTLDYIGYIVFPPRSDCRISVEGFQGEGLTADAVDELAHEYHHADECEWDLKAGTIRVWYD
jgi:hypothetical protein